MKTNSFSYYIWLSTVQFCHEFKINVILIVSMALGLLFPIFCLGNINVFVQNIETIPPSRNPESVFWHGSGWHLALR